MAIRRKATSRRPRMRLRRRHRAYRPTIFTIQQVLDTIPYELDLDKVRESIKRIASDEKLWVMLREAQGIAEEQRKIGETISKSLRKFKMK